LAEEFNTQWSGSVLGKQFAALKFEISGEDSFSGGAFEAAQEAAATATEKRR
jgi:hypothetical protein